MSHLDPNHQDGIDQIDKQGEGCLGMVVGAGVGIVLCMIIMALQGCASMPPQVTQPSLQGSAVQPNCVFWCHTIVNVGKAESDIDAEGTVTGGSQTIDLDSSQTSSKAIEPKP
jgi:hypothetical protein